MLFCFQAEDGIRDKLVTGVQTCALPICNEAFPADTDMDGTPDRHDLDSDDDGWSDIEEAGGSEERRVGKECRSRGSPDH